MYAEEKAKVVAAVWGTTFIQFLAELTILPQDDMKKRVNSSYFSTQIKSEDRIRVLVYIFIVCWDQNVLFHIFTYSLYPKIRFNFLRGKKLFPRKCHE